MQHLWITIFSLVGLLWLIFNRLLDTLNILDTHFRNTSFGSYILHLTIFKGYYNNHIWISFSLLLDFYHFTMVLHFVYILLFSVQSVKFCRFIHFSSFTIVNYSFQVNIIIRKKGNDNMLFTFLNQGTIKCNLYTHLLDY